MVDGKDNKLYCQNLALLAKLFIDHKILYFDIRDYQFIVLTQDTMKNGTIKQSTIVGYFSRQKGMQCANNLSCIVVFPQFQSRGYGTFLIALSYFLSQKENRICTPETPLSDMGRVLYYSYWKEAIFELLDNVDQEIHQRQLTMKEISKRTFIAEPDILMILKEMNLLKYYRGMHSLIDEQHKIQKVLYTYYKRKADKIESLVKADKPLPVKFENKYALMY